MYQEAKTHQFLEEFPKPKCTHSVMSKPFGFFISQKDADVNLQGCKKDITIE